MGVEGVGGMNEPAATKICTRCHEDKPRTAFNRAGNGVQPKCKACEKAYRMEHIEEARARQRAYHAAHREEIAIRVAAYNASHAKEARARASAWKKANPERAAETLAAYRAERSKELAEKQKERARLHPEVGAAWRAANRERIRAYRASYRLTHPPSEEAKAKRRASLAAWKKANSEKVAASNHTRRARKRNLPSERVLLPVLFERDGGICGICKKRVYKNARDVGMKPSHDHVIPISKGGHNTYANAQLAHRRCNSVKGARLVPRQVSFFDLIA